MTTLHKGSRSGFGRDQVGLVQYPKHLLDGSSKLRASFRNGNRSGLPEITGLDTADWIYRDWVLE